MGNEEEIVVVLIIFILELKNYPKYYYIITRSTH